MTLLELTFEKVVAHVQNGGVELWCMSCKSMHCPTVGHPICPDAASWPLHLHQPLPADVYLDHRGWRFFYPFYCFSCGRRVCPLEFAFSRSCKAHILGPFGQRIFAGKHRALAYGKRQQTDLAETDIMDIDSERARELMRGRLCLAGAGR